MSDDKAISIDEHSRVQQQLQKAEERAQRFEASLADIERKYNTVKDIDPVKYKATLEDYDNIRKENAKGDPKKIDELVSEKEARIRAEVQKELDELRGKSTKAETELRELRVVDRAHSLFGSRFNDDVQDDVKARVRKDADINEDGAIVFKDDKGQLRYSHVDRTKLMTADEYAEELANLKPSWAKATHVAGGMQPGIKSNGTGGMDPVRWLRLSPAERAKYSIDDQRKFSQEAVKTRH